MQHPIIKALWWTFLSILLFFVIVVYLIIAYVLIKFIVYTTVIIIIGALIYLGVKRWLDAS